MPYKEKDIEKVYWTIGEVADELKIETSNIRFWCKEMGIKIGRKENGNRQFKKKDRDLIHQIHRLVHLRGHTIIGAKQMIDMKDELYERIYTLIITRRDHATEEILNLFY